MSAVTHKVFPVVSSPITCSARNFLGGESISMQTAELIQLIYDLALPVKTQGPAIHHNCDNGEHLKACSRKK